jgi:DNA-binding beta-propeller fold protein YncE
MPSGVAIGPGTDVLVTCAGHDGRQFAPTTYIINGTTGAIVSTINFVGGVDQGWFNPGDGKYYLAARDMLPGPVLGVIDARTRQWLQNVPTNGNAHSVAADPINNHIFVPLPAGGNCLSQAIDGCVGVYASE